MARKLKVFRTAIGFHDAYVAAPSRKAALAAWGSDADLFAHGMAEEVTEPALMTEALARPGEVVRRSRGTVDDHLAATPRHTSPIRPGRDEEPATPAAARAIAKPMRKPKPRPSRAALDAAEAAITAMERDHRSALEDITRRERALAEERRILERDHETEAQALGARRTDAMRRYDREIAVWRDDTD